MPHATLLASSILSLGFPSPLKAFNSELQGTPSALPDISLTTEPNAPAPDLSGASSGRGSSTPAFLQRQPQWEQRAGEGRTFSLVPIQSQWSSDTCRCPPQSASGRRAGCTPQPGGLIGRKHFLELGRRPLSPPNLQDPRRAKPAGPPEAQMSTHNFLSRTPQSLKPCLTLPRSTLNTGSRPHSSEAYLRFRVGFVVVQKISPPGSYHWVVLLWGIPTWGSRYNAESWAPDPT